MYKLQMTTCSFVVESIGSLNSLFIRTSKEVSISIMVSMTTVETKVKMTDSSRFLRSDMKYEEKKYTFVFVCKR